MGHHGAPQVQQLLQELDTVNGTIRALDEAYFRRVQFSGEMKFWILQYVSIF